MEKREYRKRVLKTALPAVILAVFIFISLMAVIEYTEAAFLVILAWIIVPVIIAKLYHRIKGNSGN